MHQVLVLNLSQGHPVQVGNTRDESVFLQTVKNESKRNEILQIIISQMEI